MSSRPPKKQIDPSTLSPEERAIYERYGQVRSKPLIKGTRKYFDSGEYEMNRSKGANGGGRASNKLGGNDLVGVGIPDPRNIPHSVPESTPAGADVAPPRASSRLASSVVTAGSDDEDDKASGTGAGPSAGGVPAGVSNQD
ncbi:hypothetical protein H696_04432 [Fonticula alba]|uniref:mRNA stability protein n=1 Tax=Fonticula alba TaxID=691883 RepID=A0A058Z687_FONAL|nr:hypothetical protein H696_04432 [Fonticula alba]KCV69012.1 hypothetical protein H696_04432 [Fonticula alba]|eukprot:XP_009496583.1 hypothetical protein H696_04432 [Fonticula alba]